MTSRIRSILIVLALAGAVYAVPSGENSAAAVGSGLSALILAALVLFAVRLYREGRGRIEVLGDAHRIQLYAALGSIVVAMAARPSLTGTGPGTLLFVVLLGLPIVMLYAVWQRWREVA